MLLAAIFLSMVFVLKWMLDFVFEAINAVDAAERRIDEERKPTQK